MTKVNENYLKLPGNYLFSLVNEKVASYKKERPDAPIINLGIGDVTLPIAPAVIEAVYKAADEMTYKDTFHGYAPDLGYDFLRKMIAEHDYKVWGCQIDNDEIFISDGAKSDTGNIQEIFSKDSKIALCDPVYTVYLDSNIMAGRAGEYNEATGKWSRIIYMPCTEENNFVPEIPRETPDLIYLCFPNNPTGTTLSRDQLKVWVEYANNAGAVILFDAAYEAYISDESVPHSIYEIPGANTCAIEFRSFSKKAGFTGMRLGFTVIPKALVRDGISLHSLWKRRHITKYNGAPYIMQKAGAAVYTPDGQRQVMEQVNYYKRNAEVICKRLSQCGFTIFGGRNSPYIWMKIPGKESSWQYFDSLLRKANVIVTPGSGFGPSGEGYIRLTAFGTYEETIQAIGRIESFV